MTDGNLMGTVVGNLIPSPRTFVSLRKKGGSSRIVQLRRPGYVRNGPGAGVSLVGS